MEMLNRAGKVTASAFLLCGLWVAYSFITNAVGFGIPCVIHMLTGLYCPGCGASRAMAALTRLDFYAALRYNAFFIAVLPVLAFYAVKSSVCYIRTGQALRSGRHDAAVGAGVTIMAALFAVARNTQLFAFLAPTAV